MKIGLILSNFYCPQVTKFKYERLTLVVEKRAYTIVQAQRQLGSDPTPGLTVVS